MTQKTKWTPARRWGVGATALAVVALRDVSPRGDGDERAAEGDRKTGRWWALAGLALAVGFGMQSVATVEEAEAAAEEAAAVETEEE